MHVVEVTPSRRWRNLVTGLTVSPYGAAPWANPADATNWVKETVGWTWRNSNGTVGRGRKPAKTQQEAIDLAVKFNTRPDGHFHSFTVAKP